MPHRHCCCCCCHLIPLLLQLEQRIAVNMEVARELVSQQKKERALLALKKKRLSEHQLASIQAYLMNVEDMVGV
jgi:charged multivesicular body protein 6